MEPQAIYLAESTVAEQEGFRSEPYLDLHGLWTIGFGFRFLASGEAVTHATMPMTRAEGDALLTRRVAVLAAQVADHVHAELNSYQCAALVDFAYNIGMPAFVGSSVCRLLCHGDFIGAANAFLLWDKVTEPHTHALVVSADLKRRRMLERTMFVGKAQQPQPRLEAVT